MKVALAPNLMDFCGLAMSCAIAGHLDRQGHLGSLMAKRRALSPSLDEKVYGSTEY